MPAKRWLAVLGAFATLGIVGSAYIATQAAGDWKFKLGIWLAAVAWITTLVVIAVARGTMAWGRARRRR